MSENLCEGLTFLPNWCKSGDTGPAI